MKRRTETRYCVVRDYISEIGDNLQDHHCVLFGTEAEATEFKGKLQDGCDPSFFPVNDEEAGFLYVEKVTI